MNAVHELTSGALHPSEYLRIAKCHGVSNFLVRYCEKGCISWRPVEEMPEKRGKARNGQELGYTKTFLIYCETIFFWRAGLP